MKKHLLMMAIAIKFGMSVRVNSGFYEGCSGAVVGHEEANINHVELFQVSLTCKGEDPSVTYYPTDLFTAEQLEREKK